MTVHFTFHINDFSKLAKNGKDGKKHERNKINGSMVKFVLDHAFTRVYNPILYNN